MLLAVKDAARDLNVTPKKVYELIEQGQLPIGVVVRLGRQIKINSERLQTWIERGGTAAEPAGIAG